MELSEQQRQAVKEWVAAGSSLSDVQKNLKSEFGITATYIDVRLLVLEIGAEVKDKPAPKPPKTEAPKPAAAPQDDPYADEFEDEPGLPPAGGAEEAPLPEGAAAGKVAMTLDRLVVPGAMVSGDVTFSDGVKARWLIDQYGRFGLEPSTPGYRPSPADLQAFQTQLRLELQRHGYA
ncbi:MAG TPA: hypothetical protein PKM57_10365 [Kiritimatiellia bacterium]|jgi:hypothetical protein|nr:hypothetical protein [Kiritimatiellia bacterium]HPS07486.1 hypothetical protein [Kiritimatiellia bacterium]